jgi:hypothetical protein
MTLTQQLKNLIKEQNEIAGEWNGDESGIQEDNAHEAQEIIDLAEQLLEKLNQE